MFAEVAGTTREAVLNDWPDAVSGVSADHATEYLKARGHEARIYAPHTVVTASLCTSIARGGHHWVCQVRKTPKTPLATTKLLKNIGGTMDQRPH